MLRQPTLLVSLTLCLQKDDVDCVYCVDGTDDSEQRINASAWLGAKNKHWDVVLILIKKGANPQMKFKQNNVLQGTVMDFFFSELQNGTFPKHLEKEFINISW